MSWNRLLPLLLVVLASGLIAVGCGDDDDDGGGDDSTDVPSVTLDSGDGETTTIDGEEVQQNAEEAQENAEEAIDDAQQNLEGAREECIKSAEQLEGESADSAKEACEAAFPE